MSSTASNYDLRMLFYGITVAGLSVVIAFVSSLSVVSKSLLAFFAFGIITLVYGIMMFASSFVEEEQQFWYWAASGWLVYLTGKTYVS